MAETLIIILAEHNVPINFADHFTNLHVALIYM